MYLQLRNLRKVFGDIIAVDNLNIDVAKGQLIALLGPSGCGKTTTLRMIGGFLKPDEGEIILDSINITNVKPEKRPVATVFQNYALFPHMNVYENVSYGLKYEKEFSQKEKKQRTEEILEMVGLQSYYRQNAGELSGGQQQRVALARALVIKPKILLLDEPFSNLDAKLRIKMRKEIKEIQKKLNMTMVFVTHDQEEALSISDIIVIMDKGKLCQAGVPEEIYYHPRNKFVADFIGRANIIHDEKGVTIIRPEHIIMHRKDGELKGKIIFKQFLGAVTTYYVEIKEMIFQIDCTSLKGNEYKVGEEVYLHFQDKFVLTEGKTKKIFYNKCL